MPPETHYVPTSDGWTLALHRYAARPPRRRHPLLLVHGMAANRLHFDLDRRHSLATAAQARGFDTWVVELRGAGLTLAPGGRNRALYSWGFADYAERDVPAALAAVLAHSGARCVHALGHSMGGMLCYALAARGQAPLRSIVTIGSPLIGDLHLGTKERRVLQLAATLGPGVPFSPTPQRRVPMRRVLSAAALLGNWSARLVDNFALNVANCEAATLLLLAREGIDDIPARLPVEIARHARAPDDDGPFAYERHLGEVRCPTLVLSGAADRIATPASVAALVDRLAGRDVRWRPVGTAFGEASDYGHVDLLIGRQASEEIYLPALDFCLEHDA